MAALPAPRRFTVSKEGVIADSKTGLEWLVGPDADTNFAKAETWVKNCTVAGGNWRMPTKAELATVHEKGSGPRNMPPVFRTQGWWAWSADKMGSSASWYFDFQTGADRWYYRILSRGGRAFAVRSGK
jgi:hypothetical protein